MKTYSLWSNGEKLVREDLQAAALLAGTADDEVRASLKQIPIEGSNAGAWIEPWHDGPVVVANGATGTVMVLPFQAFRGPTGATANAGTQDAVSGGNDAHALTSAWYPGTGAMAGATPGTAAAGIAIATPLPASLNIRWDLLYAIVSDADSTAAARLVKDPSTGVIATQTVNTRHSPAVTLAWVQGTPSTTTDPYPPANMPVLGTPPAGMSYIPLAYVVVAANATPSTVTYTVDKIAEVAPRAPQNPGSGVTVSTIAPAGVDAAGGATALGDAPSLIALPSASGGWFSGGQRPIRYIEPVGGEVELWLPIFMAGATASASWTLINQPLSSPLSTDTVYKRGPRIDWRNRWFEGRIFWAGSTGVFWAHDSVSAASGCVWPTSMPNLGTPQPAGKLACGNSVRDNPDFDTESGFVAGTWRVAAMFRDITSATANNDIALLVKISTGALFMAYRQATAGVIVGRSGLVRLCASQMLQNYGLT